MFCKPKIAGKSSANPGCPLAETNLGLEQVAAAAAEPIRPCGPSRATSGYSKRLSQTQLLWEVPFLEKRMSCQVRR